MARTVAVVSGSRSEYGILRPLLRAIDEDPALALQLIVTGSHLWQEYGLTLQEIKADEFPIAGQVDILTPEDTGAGMARSFALAVTGMADLLGELRPDCLVVEGDRYEILATTIGAVHLGIPVFHLGGGDTSCGGLDEGFRHAISKLAHVHLVSNEQAAARLIRMGEDPKQVHVVGEPALDTIRKESLIPREALFRRFGLRTAAPLVVAVQHPRTTVLEKAAEEMRETLAALKRLALPTMLIYPNSDAGGKRMIRVIKEEAGEPFFHVLPSVSHVEFLSLLKECAVLAGNSSAGLLEAPSFATPVVNIGPRQVGRPAAANVIHCPHEAGAIEAALRRAIDPAFRKGMGTLANPYGDGHSTEKILPLLKGQPLGPELLQKKNSY